MNLLIKDITAIVPDGEGFAEKQCSICVKDDIIEAVGDIPADFVPDRTISGKDKLATAGFINCHTHSYMTLFRNFADDLSFDEWLFKRIMPHEDNLSGDDAYWGALLGCMEMLQTGTTAFLDMHMFPDACARAADESGIRAVLSRGLVGSDRNDAGGIRRVNEAKAEMLGWKGHQRLTFAIGPHAIYTTERPFLEYMAELSDELKVPIHIHLSETRYEVSECMRKNGVSPVKYLEQTGILDRKTIAAHCVHISDEDIDILSEKNVSVAANPRSNLKLGNGFAPLKKLLDKNVNVCIGTDGAASNNSLNLFADMNYTAMIHKGTNETPQCISAQEVHRFVTRNGAEALGLYNTGSLEAGKKADITIIDLDRPQFCPRQNLTAALAYSANGSEVDTVIVDGEIVVEHGKATKIDAEKVYFNVNRIARW